ncbi:putative signal transducing protein [Olleya sp. R77988]|uniref:putative signal transducing protein n=1 Tax=Olleya sp. R77988 TaxID=3093875 RepID=UPI0037CA84CA
MSQTFKTIAKFQYTAEAQIIKGRLESEGIQVFLSDNITIDTDPLVSNAIGGVKLKVLAKDAMQAQHILESINKYSVDDDGNAIHCPNCNSQEVAMFSTIKDFKSFFAFVFGFLFGSLPFYSKDKYRCDNCNTEFDIK